MEINETVLEKLNSLYEANKVATCLHSPLINHGLDSDLVTSALKEMVIDSDGTMNFEDDVVYYRDTFVPKMVNKGYEIEDIRNFITTYAHSSVLLWCVLKLQSLLGKEDINEDFSNLLRRFNGEVFYVYLYLSCLEITNNKKLISRAMVIASTYDKYYLFANDFKCKDELKQELMTNFECDDDETEYILRMMFCKYLGFLHLSNHYYSESNGDDKFYLAKEYEFKWD